MRPLKALIVTIVIVGLLWWCYCLTDAYAFGAHQILAGILDVAGLLGIGVAIYVFLRMSDDGKLIRGKTQTWDQEYSSWQR